MSPSDFGDGGLASQSTYPVIAGVDGSFSAIRAARWAAAVAEKSATNTGRGLSLHPFGTRVRRPRIRSNA